MERSIYLIVKFLIQESNITPPELDYIAIHFETDCKQAVDVLQSFVQRANFTKLKGRILLGGKARRGSPISNGI